MVGVIAGDQLHLQPLHSLQLVRPDMAYLDRKEIVSGQRPSGADGDVMQRVTSQFRKMDDRAAAARRSSFAFLQALEERDALLNLVPLGPDSTAATAALAAITVHQPPRVRGMTAPPVIELDDAGVHHEAAPIDVDTSTTSIGGAEPTTKYASSVVVIKDEIAGADGGAAAATSARAAPTHTDEAAGSYLRALAATGRAGAARSGGTSGVTAGAGASLAALRGRQSGPGGARLPPLPASLPVGSTSLTGMPYVPPRNGPTPSGLNASRVASGQNAAAHAAAAAAAANAPRPSYITMAQLEYQPPAVQVEELLRRAGVMPFSRIAALATAASDYRELLEHCARAARLVRGNWVLKSDLAYGLHWSVRIAHHMQQLQASSNKAASGGRVAGAGADGAAAGPRAAMVDGGDASSGVTTWRGGHSIAAQLGLRPALHQHLMAARDYVIACFIGGGAELPLMTELQTATRLDLQYLRPIVESLSIRVSSADGTRWRLKEPDDTAFEATFRSYADASRRWAFNRMTALHQAQTATANGDVAVASVAAGTPLYLRVPSALLAALAVKTAPRAAAPTRRRLSSTSSAPGAGGPVDEAAFLLGDGASLEGVGAAAEAADLLPADAASAVHIAAAMANAAATSGTSGSSVHVIAPGPLGTLAAAGAPGSVAWIVAEVAKTGVPAPPTHHGAAPVVVVADTAAATAGDKASPLPRLPVVPEYVAAYKKALDEPSQKALAGLLTELLRSAGVLGRPQVVGRLLDASRDVPAVKMLFKAAGWNTATTAAVAAAVASASGGSSLPASASVASQPVAVTAAIVKALTVNLPLLLGLIDAALEPFAAPIPGLPWHLYVCRSNSAVGDDRARYAVLRLFADRAAAVARRAAAPMQSASAAPPLQVIKREGARTVATAALGGADLVENALTKLLKEFGTSSGASWRLKTIE